MKNEVELKALQAQGVFKGSKQSPSAIVTRTATVLSDVVIEDGEEMSFITRMTSPTVDREGECVVLKGMDVSEYLQNPVLCWAHTYSILPVGKAEALAPDGEGLKGKFRVSATTFGKDLWQLIKDGALNTVSIGFLRLEVFKKGQVGFLEACRKAGVEAAAGLKQICTRSILVETSLVCLPCHKEALILAAATKGLSELAIKLGVETGSEVSEIAALDEEEGAKPFPHEHSARQESPDTYKRFKRMNGIANGVSFILGIDEENKTHVQSIRFDSSKFTEDAAIAWLGQHNFSATEFVAATQVAEKEVVPEAKPDEVVTAEPPVAEAKAVPPVVEEVPPVAEAKAVPPPVVEEVPVPPPEPVAKATPVTCTICGEPLSSEGGECKTCAKKKEEVVEPIIAPPPPVDMSVKVLRYGPPITILRIGGYKTTAADIKKAEALRSGRVL